MSRSRIQNVPLAVMAAALAWIVPGAGHLFIGRPVRAIIICLTVAATFWAGVAMGGVMTVDPVNERWWFVTDLFAGVHGLVGWHLQQRVYDRILADPSVRQRQVSLSHDPVQAAAVIDEKLQEQHLALTTPTDTIARAYAGIAGLLNLMCVFDVMILALMGVRGEPPPSARHAQQQVANP